MIVFDQCIGGGIERGVNNHLLSRVCLLRNTSVRYRKALMECMFTYYRLEAVVEPWIEGLWDALSSLFDQETNEEVWINKINVRT